MDVRQWNLSFGSQSGGGLSSHQFSVGLAEIRVVNGPTLLECQGIGSCIAVIAYDAHACVSGVAHIILPKRLPSSSSDRPGTFMDTAVEYLLNELVKAGAVAERLKWAYAGGSDFVHLASGASLPALELGRRNSEAAKSELSRLGAEVVGNDTGGTTGRDVSFCTADGDVKVRTVHEGEKTICNLQ